MRQQTQIRSLLIGIVFFISLQMIGYACVLDTASQTELEVYQAIISHYKIQSPTFRIIDVTIPGFEIERQNEFADSNIINDFIEQSKIQKQISQQFIQKNHLLPIFVYHDFEFFHRYKALFNHDLRKQVIKEDSLWSCILGQLFRGPHYALFKTSDTTWRVQFSRVGFNKQKTRALVYFEVILPLPNAFQRLGSAWCGNMPFPAILQTGSGDYAILEKKLHRWNIVKLAKSWFQRKTETMFSEYP
jgi:hypothetical protein